MKSVVRIANAGGYWGDDPDALLRQVTGGPVDYVTMDFLAEITMVILQRQRQRDPRAGFAYDFVEQLGRALPAIVEHGTTVIVNAGGINPAGCADAVAALGWAWNDWDRLAAGIAAGHILECRAQATGGNFTDWLRIPSMLDVGYPIAEVQPDGTFVVTKHPNTGGIVTPRTITEQLLYEI